MASLTRRSFSSAALAAAVLLLPACDEPDGGPVDGTYIARVDDTLIAIVVSTTDELTSAYACDGREGVDAPSAAWFAADRDGSVVELTGERGALTVRFDGELAVGELRLDGAEPRAYEAALASTGALLWGHAETGDMPLGGWIFADDGTQRGAVIKRLTGDLAASSLTDQSVSSATFGASVLTIKPMLTPTVVP